MPLTPEQIELIHKMKDSLNVDKRMGHRLSEHSKKRQNKKGLTAISPEDGERISRDEFNPAMEFILGNL